MLSTRQLQHETTRPAPDVFTALVHAVQQGSYKIAGLSNEQHEVLFASGRTALSWGHLYRASVRPSPTGAVVELAVSGIPGAPMALLDGRKNKKAGEKLLRVVDEVLAGPAAPVAQPVASFATLEDGSTVPWTSGPYPGA